MKDTAYTSEALDAHTDNTYFTDPSGYQMFHLLSHTNGSGGESLLVDGFRCAAILAKEDPGAFKTLCDQKQRYHCNGNEGVSLFPTGQFPVIGLRARSAARKIISLVQTDRSLAQMMPFMRTIRWNRYDRATFSWTPPTQRAAELNDAETWYEAARKWSDIIKRSDSEYWEQLRPGRPLSMLCGPWLQDLPGKS